MARTVKCPSCGAELTIKDDNRDFMFCEYCGTKVRLDDYQETHRFVDEARLKEAEVRMKQLEMEEAHNKEVDENLKKNPLGPLKAIAVMLTLPFIFLIYAFLCRAVLG